MKLYGRSVKGPNVEVLVIPRKDFDIVIHAQAVLDETSFDTLCPRPKPPKIVRAGSTATTEDFKDPEYTKQINRYGELRTAWLILYSLAATPKETLEWERVQLDNPNTWLLWREELRDAFFTDYEITQISNVVFAANGVNQEKLDEARNRFLSGLVRVPEENSQPLKDDQKTTPSGEPVNVS